MKRRCYKPANKDEHLSLPRQVCLTCHFDPGMWKRVRQSGGESLFLQKEMISTHRTSCFSNPPPAFSFSVRGRKSLEAIRRMKPAGRKVVGIRRLPRGTPEPGGCEGCPARRPSPPSARRTAESEPLPAPLGSGAPSQTFGSRLCL